MQRRINKEIDRQLLRDKKDMKRELKLLLLGKTIMAKERKGRGRVRAHYYCLYL